MFLFPAAISILRIALTSIFFNFESPLYLASINKVKDAERVLVKLYKGEYVQEELRATIQQVEANEKKKMNIGVLLTKRYLIRVILGVFITFNIQFSGINAVTFYSQKLFEKYVTNQSTADLLNIVLSIVNLLANMLSGRIVDLSGRKKVFLFGDTICMISLALLAILYQLEYPYASLAMIFLYSISFCASIGPLIFIILPEILPDQGISLVLTFYWLFAFIVGLTYPPMTESTVGIPGTFGFYSCCCFVGILVFIALFKETKGKNNMEISQIYCKGQEPVKDKEQEKDYELKGNSLYQPENTESDRVATLNTLI